MGKIVVHVYIDRYSILQSTPFGVCSFSVLPRISSPDRIFRSDVGKELAGDPGLGLEPGTPRAREYNSYITNINSFGIVLPPARAPQENEKASSFRSLCSFVFPVIGMYLRLTTALNCESIFSV